MQLTIVSIPVKDQQRAKAFYRDVLGFTVTQEENMGPQMTWLQMAPPSGGVGIALVTWFESMPPGSSQGLVLEADNIDETHSHLIKRGLKVSNISGADWGRYAAFSDVDGNGWILTQAKPGA